jgi:hypothetical protein
VVIEPLSDEDGGGFLATVPELPGCVSDGEARAEALANVEDAIATWIYCAQGGPADSGAAAASGGLSRRRALRFLTAIIERALLDLKRTPYEFLNVRVAYPKAAKIQFGRYGYARAAAFGFDLQHTIRMVSSLCHRRSPHVSHMERTGNIVNMFLGMARSFQ